MHRFCVIFWGYLCSKMLHAELILVLAKNTYKVINSAVCKTKAFICKKIKSKQWNFSIKSYCYITILSHEIRAAIYIY